MEKIMEELKGKLGKEVFNEELQTLVKAQITEEVNTRLKALEIEMREKILEEASKQYEAQVKKIENDAVEASKEIIKEEKAKTERELREFKESIVNKLSDFMEVELKEAIPAELMEAQAKLAILEPIVEDVKSALTKNYINPETEQYKVLEQAKAEIKKLRNEKSKLIEESINYKKAAKNLEKKSIVDKICTELTEAQATRFKMLSEGFSVEELKKGKWESLVDIVLEESTDSDKKAAMKTDEKVKKAKIIVEDKQPEAKKEDTSIPADMRLYAQEYQKMTGKTQMVKK